MNNDFNKKYPITFLKKSDKLNSNADTVNNDASEMDSLSNEFRDSLYDDIASLSSNANLIRSHVDTIILKTLEKCDRYGYEIIDLIANSTLNKYKIKQPTLYNCLKRLEKQGYINSYMSDEKSNGGRRKYYRLVEKGLNLLKQDKREWEFSRTILNKLLSDREVDLRAEDTPFESTSIKPLTKRIKISDDGLIKSNFSDFESKDCMTYDPNLLEQNLQIKLSQIKSDFIDSCLNDLKSEFDSKFTEGKTILNKDDNCKSATGVALNEGVTTNPNLDDIAIERAPITIEELFKIIDEKLAHKESVVNDLISNIDSKSTDVHNHEKFKILRHQQDPKSETSAQQDMIDNFQKGDLSYTTAFAFKGNSSLEFSNSKCDPAPNVVSTSPYHPTEMSIDFSEITKALKLAIDESNISKSDASKIATEFNCYDSINSDATVTTISSNTTDSTIKKEQQQSKASDTSFNAPYSHLTAKIEQQPLSDKRLITGAAIEFALPIEKKNSINIFINKAIKDATFITYLLFTIALLVAVVLNKKIEMSFVGLLSLFLIATIAPIIATVNYSMNAKKVIGLNKFNWAQLYFSCGIAMALFITIFMFFIVLVGKNSYNNYLFTEKITLCLALSLIFPIFILILKGMIKSSIYNAADENK